MAAQDQHTAEQEMPGLSSGPITPDGVQQPTDAPKDSTFNRRRTALHEAINELWGYEWIGDAAFSSIIKYANPDSASINKKGALMLDLLDGHKIMWQPPSQEDPNERITCSNRHFNAEAAAAMVALARARGWKTLTLTGTVEQKEMLWLEAMRQNLQDYEIYLQEKRDGLTPRDANGKPIEYQPLQVSGFMPLADSVAYQTWARELQAWRDAHPELDGEPAEVKQGMPEPEKKPEEAKPEAEKQPEAEKKPEPEKKKPAPKKAAPVKKDPVKSKFMQAAKKTPNSKFMTGPASTKPKGKPPMTKKARNNLHPR